jgi:uncharacterized membrane protein YbaN (DUF454 family)
MQLIWRLLALLALATGIIGVVVPVLPTVPCVLVDAWAAGKGWPQLEQRLLAHPVYGTHIREWRSKRTVPRRAKWLASVMMLTSAVALQFSPAPLWVRIAVPIFLTGTAAWLWLRPEPRT